MCSLVWTLIDNGKLANQIARLVAIVVKILIDYGRHLRTVFVSLDEMFLYSNPELSSDIRGCSLSLSSLALSDINEMSIVQRISLTRRT